MSWRALLPLFAAVFIDTFSFGLMYPAITALFQQHWITTRFDPAMRDAMLSLAFALFPLGMFFGASVLGDLSDALGRRRTLLICMAGLAAAYALMAGGIALAALWLFLLGRLLSGVMAGTGPIAQAAMMDVTTEADRAANMAMVVLVNCIALVSGPAIGGMLGHLDLRAPLVFALVLCLLAFAWIARGVPEQGVRGAVQITLAAPIAIFLRALRHPVLSGLALSFLLYQFGFGIFFTLSGVRMQAEYGFTAFELGAWSATLGMGFVIGTTAGEKLAKAWLKDDARITVVALGGCAIVLLASALDLGGLIGQWVLVLLAGIIDIVAYVGSLTLISAAAPKEEQGWALGIGASMMALAFFFSGLMAATLAVLPAEMVIAIGGLAVALAILPLRAAWARRPALVTGPTPRG